MAARGSVGATANLDSPAMKAAEEQVVANAQAIAASIEPFYGAAAKEAFFKLLAGHYSAIKAYLIATIGSWCMGRCLGYLGSGIKPDSSGRDARLDQHRFRPLGKLVVGNLDRIADVDDVGD
jgi:hypothetical protein